LVYPSEEEPMFHHRWDKLPVDHYTESDADSHGYGEEPDVLGELKTRMGEIQGELGKGEKALLYLIGKEAQLHKSLSVLPELARDYPDVKVVVAGMQKFPVTINAAAQEQFSIVETKPPTLEDAISKLSGSFRKLGKIQTRYAVKLTADAIKQAAETHMFSNSKRPPTQDQLIGKLERVASWARMKAPPVPRKTKPEPIEITPETVQAFDTERENYIHALSGVPDREKGGFYDVKHRTGVKFDQIIGQKDAVEKVRHLTKRMKDNPFDIDLPRLVIFKGPPGHGKTMVAEAMAEESGVNLISVNAARFAEMYVGVAAKRVDEIFERANDGRPWIIFIDEVDSVAKERTGATDGGAEKEDALNQLLTKISGFSKALRNKVTVVVATNKPELLDNAFTDRGEEIEFKRFSTDERRQILEVHRKSAPPKVVFADDVNFQLVAEKAVSLDSDRRSEDQEGFSGRKLSLLVQEAIFQADKEAKDGEPPVVTQKHLMDQLRKKQGKPPRRMGFKLPGRDDTE
jgi:AAA+ superfamily predicted ATPase